MQDRNGTEELIWRVLDGEAAPGEEARLQELAAKDPQIAAQWQNGRALYDRLAKAKDMVTPQGLEERILASLRWRKGLPAGNLATAPAARSGWRAWWARLAPHGGNSKQCEALALDRRASGAEKGGKMSFPSRFPMNHFVALAAAFALLASAAVYVSVVYPPLDTAYTQGAIGKRDVYREAQVKPEALEAQAPSTLNAEAFLRWTKTPEYKSLCANATFQAGMKDSAAFFALLQNEAFQQMLVNGSVYQNIIRSQDFQNLLNNKDFQLVMSNLGIEAAIRNAYQATYGIEATAQLQSMGPAAVRVSANSGVLLLARDALQNSQAASHPLDASGVSSGAAAKAMYVKLDAFGPIVLAAWNNLQQNASFQLLWAQKDFQCGMADPSFRQCVSNNAFLASMNCFGSFAAMQNNAAFQGLLQSDNFQALFFGQALFSTLANNTAFADTLGGAGFQALLKNKDFQALMQNTVFQQNLGIIGSTLQNEEIRSFIGNSAFQQHAPQFFVYLTANPAVMKVIGSKEFGACVNAMGPVINAMGPVDVVESQAYQNLMQSKEFGLIASDAGFQAFIGGAAFRAALDAGLMKVQSNAAFQQIVSSGVMSSLLSKFGPIVLSQMQSDAFLALLQNEAFQNLAQNSVFLQLMGNSAFQSSLAYGPIFLNTMKALSQMQSAYAVII